MANKLGLFVQALVVLSGMTPSAERVVDPGPAGGPPKPSPKPRQLWPLFPAGRIDPDSGLWVCACGAKANPHDKRWRGLSVKALHLAMGWENRDGVMVCPGCRACQAGRHG